MNGGDVDGGGEEEQSSIAEAMSGVMGGLNADISELPGMLASGWKQGLGLLGFQPNKSPSSSHYGYQNFTPSNSLYDMIHKPELAVDMFSNIANIGPGQRNFGLPQGTNVNTDRMVSDIMNAINNKGFLPGHPSTYASWGLTDKQAQDWEDQINNLNFSSWDSDVDITSKPAGQSANPHMDTVSISEKTGAGFGKPLGQFTGQTNINFGLPMGWNDPTIGISGRGWGRGRAQPGQYAGIDPDRGDLPMASNVSCGGHGSGGMGGFGGWT